MSYYVRVRGRVQGPFSVEQLRVFIQKGQLSRIHEISQDQQSWSKVADFPELFAAPMVEQAPTAAAGYSQPDVYQQPQYAAPQPQYQSPQPQYPGAGYPQQSAPSAAEPQWHYSQHGSQMGPVPQSTLQQMLATGQLSPETQVWTQGMGDWARARQVPQLAATAQATNPYAAPQTVGFVSQHTGSGTEKYHPAIIQSIAGSWIWVLYVVITCYLGLIGSFIYMLLTLVALSKFGGGGGPVFTLMLLFFVFSIPLILVTIFSHRYMSSISSFTRMPGEHSLIRVLSCSRDYWRVIGGMACIYLFLTIIGLIFMLAMGLDMAMMRSRL